MDREKTLPIIALLTGSLIILLVLGNAYLENPEKRYDETRTMMGTYVTIVIYHTDGDEATAIMDAAFARMEAIAAMANRYRPTSELSRLNTEGSLPNPSPELVEMISMSIQYWTITGGAFDVTILPLLELWDLSSGSGPFDLFTMEANLSGSLDSGSIGQGVRTAFSDHEYPLNETPELTVFEPGQRWTVRSGGVRYSVVNGSGELRVTTDAFWNVHPSRQDEYINHRRQLTGPDRIVVTGTGITIPQGMRITLDGMAKGYVVDAAIRLLRDRGIRRAMVDAGGDIATLGTKPDGERWMIGLRDPEGRQAPVTEFGLKGQAIATSGNYERYFDENRSVGHIMDPRTGKTAFTASSATVIAPNCTVADILATGTFVLGPHGGIGLVNGIKDTEALIIGYDDPRELFRSTGLDRYETGGHGSSGEVTA